MNIFNADKIMNRIDKMIDNAINGLPVEKSFDESKMSAIETKLSRYLAIIGMSKAQLLEEKASINALVSDISHQTKTPIANILLYSQLLEEDDLSEQNRLCVKALTEQAEKLNFLIASLVKTSRLETGIISLSPKYQPIQPMLDSVLTQSEIKAQNKGIIITHTKTQLNAVFDSKWTVEAIYNILDNAIKYTPYGGSISISVTAYQFFCKIDIADTGIGISEEEITSIFKRFYRSPNVSSSEGVGIGLYIAREIMGNEGAYIKVKSKMGIGSTFSIFIPMEIENRKN